MRSRIYKKTPPSNDIPARELLLLSDSEPLNADRIEELLLSRGFYEKMNAAIGSLIVEEELWDMALDMAAHSDNAQVAFRISWSLEWAYQIESQQIERRYGRFFEDFLASRNESVLRVYSKMLLDMLQRDIFTLSDTDAERLAEKSFDLLVGHDTSIAVKGWQIEILFYLIPRIDWVEENLTETVRTMSESPDCTPGIASTARHYFKSVRRLKRNAEPKHGK